MSECSIHRISHMHGNQINHCQQNTLKAAHSVINVSAQYNTEQVESVISWSHQKYSYT